MLRVFFIDGLFVLFRVDVFNFIHIKLVKEKLTLSYLYSFLSFCFAIFTEGCSPK